MLGGVGRHTPRDEIKSFSEWKALRAAANTPDESGNLPELNDPERLTDYRGLIVTFPRGFLANQQKRSLAESFLGELRPPPHPLLSCGSAADGLAWRCSRDVRGRRRAGRVPVRLRASAPKPIHQ